MFPVFLEANITRESRWYPGAMKVETKAETDLIYDT